MKQTEDVWQDGTPATASSAAGGYRENVQALLSLRKRCELSQQEEALWAAELDRLWRHLSEEQQNSIEESLRDGREPEPDA